MSSSPSSPPIEVEVSGTGSAGVAPPSRWRVAVLRTVAAAHVVAGIVEILQVGGNALLRLPYTAGPLSLPGAVAVVVARFLFCLTKGWPSDLETFHLRSHWIENQAQSLGSFLGAMMAAHVALGALAAALGYGLWRRRPWARWLDIAVLGASGFLVLAHVAALFGVRGMWREFAVVAWVSPLVVVLPILAFLLSPRTGRLFRDGSEMGAAPWRRRWWTLSLQWAAGLLVVAMACALVLLFGLGPMAEAVWIAAEATMG
jgi:uncharacterized membrane protein (DUF2068 family)